jgi:hypothetical protein
MNICDYIKQNNIPHRVLPDGRMKQIVSMHLAWSKITSLNGFVQQGWLSLCGNKIVSLDGFTQNGRLDLSYNQISSLDGFEQNGWLDLSYNNITSLKGFVQNGPLNLGFNFINSLDDFVPNNKFIIIGNGIFNIKRKRISVIYSKGKLIIMKYNKL